MGWGKHTIAVHSQSQHLRKVTLEVSPEKIYNDNFFTTIIRRNDAGTVMDVCAGDSGGPLVHQDPTSKRWTIIGTVFGGNYNCYWGVGEQGSSVWNKVTAHL